MVSNNQYIQSPGYPSNYANRLSCDWTIEKPGNYKVLLTFSTISTESCCDAVRVYNYVNGREQLLREYKGSHSQVRLQSSGNKMRVRFTTDGSVTDRGFRALVTFGKIF